MTDRKIIVLGDSSVGKTAVIRKWLHYSYSTSEQGSTHGAGFHQNDVFVNGQMQKIQVWDTAGEEKYRSMVPIYARGACGILLFFDISKRQSFESLKFWKEAAGNIPVVLVGNKADLNIREVTQDEIFNLAAEFHCEYYETSAITGLGVDNAFLGLLNNVIPVETAAPSVLSTGRKEQDEAGAKAKNCC